MAVNKNTLQESAIVKGIPNHEELKIYLDRRLFEIDMLRFNIPNKSFVEAVGLIEKFSEAEGVSEVYSTYIRSTNNKSTNIVFHGTYDSPMTSNGIEQFYDDLCSKLGR